MITPEEKTYLLASRKIDGIKKKAEKAKTDAARCRLINEANHLKQRLRFLYPSEPLGEEL